MTVDLASYRAKRERDLARSAEPSGRHDSGSASDPQFVVQHHLAAADHYDFRLEIDGVLVSWAIPKSPSTEPRERWLAKRTEDHPLDYADFEGVVTHGQHGGGTVQVWDRGRFVNTSQDGDTPISAEEALVRGHISLRLTGEKLRGGYSVIRTDGEYLWLLVKKRDKEADARRDSSTARDESVLTGRTMDEIEADASRPRRMNDRG